MGIDVNVDIEYTVVVNNELQYSIWPEIKPLPEGWVSGGFSGSKADCLEYIKTHWTDMRPLSLREDLILRQEKLKSQLRAAAQQPVENFGESSLITFLLDGKKEVKLHPNEHKNQSIEEIIQTGLFHLQLSFKGYHTYLRIRFKPTDNLKGPQVLCFSGFLEVDFTLLECQGSINMETGEGLCTFVKSKEKK